ncbi:MAG: choline dehydrogenase, partial [Rhodobacteraceae bacterium]|nr:choline dehydrogenase [Paracoccaceae bacterium]
KWLLGMPNILALVPSQVFLFCKSQPGIDFADLQCVFTPGSYKEGKHYVLDNYPGVTGGWWQHRPQSRGYVRAQSKDVYIDPIINPNYLDDTHDQDTMVRGMKIVRDLLNSPSMSKYLTNEVVPGVKVQTDEELLEFCKNFGSTCYHLVGTAKMGQKLDSKAVVDQNLRVHGIKNLRVIDASVMPMIPSGNTYAATMMIAEKGSDIIKQNVK